MEHDERTSTVGDTKLCVRKTASGWQASMGIAQDPNAGGDRRLKPT